jgi:hypothetical protein
MVARLLRWVDSGGVVIKVVILNTLLEKEDAFLVVSRSRRQLIKAYYRVAEYVRALWVRRSGSALP